MEAVMKRVRVFQDVPKRMEDHLQAVVLEMAEMVGRSSAVEKMWH